MITINQLSKAYNGITVLNIPSMTIGAGESFGLVGNNGAGKTTLFRLILDLTAVTTGEVLSSGQEVARQDAWKSYTGSFLDESFLIDYLTPEEYFYFIGKLHDQSEEQVDAFLETMSDLFNGEVIGTKKLIRTFSKGNQKKIGIAAALIANPRLLILDEPFTALDPSSQIRLKRFLTEVREQTGMTMLISSHDLNHVTEVCQRIVVLEKGEVIKDIHTDDSTLKELENYFAV